MCFMFMPKNARTTTRIFPAPPPDLRSTTRWAPRR